jgi:hypothetical protein
MSETKTKTATTEWTKAPKAEKQSKKVVSLEAMEKYASMVHFVKNTIGTIEGDLKRIKAILAKMESFDASDVASLVTDAQLDEVMGSQGLQSYTEEDAQVVEWVFDGYFMIGADQKKYPVPLNYASKTKLVPGDMLKLKILTDGKFVYKLIRPVERKHVRGVLSKTDDNKFVAMTDDGKTFFLNQAAVTFFKGKTGDELYIITNAEGAGSFAAIEAVIKK